MQSHYNQEMLIFGKVQHEKLIVIRFPEEFFQNQNISLMWQVHWKVPRQKPVHRIIDNQIDSQLQNT